MAKPEWGTKRICQSCGARFYDLLRNPVVCPKCGTEFDPEALLRNRKVRTTSDKTSSKTRPKTALPEESGLEELEAVPIESSETAEVENESGDDGLIEDADDLGKDEDDIPEISEGNEDE